uniref:Uncharacterized protein n=1 Tax=Arundo donax TaxID=35708 RepID=A0A0A9DLE8_ARUDO
MLKVSCFVLIFYTMQVSYAFMEVMHELQKRENRQFETYLEMKDMFFTIKENMRDMKDRLESNEERCALLWRELMVPTEHRNLEQELQARNYLFSLIIRNKCSYIFCDVTMYSLQYSEQQGKHPSDIDAPVGRRVRSMWGREPRFSPILREYKYSEHLRKGNIKIPAYIERGAYQCPKLLCNIFYKIFS